MKLRLLALILCLAMVMCLPAMAETTRVDTIYMEGEPYEVEKTLFVKEDEGYSLWYDAETFDYIYEIDSFEPVDESAFQADMQIENLGEHDSDEAFADIVEELLGSFTAEYGEPYELETEGMFTDYKAVGFEFESYDNLLDLYVVSDGLKYFSIILTYAAEAAEGYGARLRDLASGLVID